MRVLRFVVAVWALGMFSAMAPLAAGDAAPDPSPKTEAGKWETDEPVRDGMLVIRDLVRLNHSLITHRRMPPDHAVRFAGVIKQRTKTILAKSTIQGEARERLGSLLDEVAAGVDAVAHPEAGTDPIDGLVRVDEALAQYPKAFDDPDWKPVQSLD
jgi:hypothetical protein